jgi:hypothetical protein
MASGLEVHGGTVWRKRTFVYFLGTVTPQCVDTVVAAKVPSTAYPKAAQCEIVIGFTML